MKYQYVYLIVFISSFFTGCNHTKEHLDKLKHAESLLDLYPDSALSVLRTISENSLDEKNLDHYLLLNIQARDKSMISIENDTIIFRLQDKYIRSEPDKATLIYFYSGKIAEQRKDLPEALHYYLQAEQLVNPENHKMNGLIKSHIGKLLYTQLHINSAKEQFKTALLHFEAANDSSNIIITHSQLGNCFLIENNIDTAFIHYKCCETLLEYSNDYRDRGAIINNLAKAYQLSGEKDKAKTLLKKSLTYSKIDLNDLCKIYTNLAENYQEHTDSFNYYIQEAMTLADSANNPLLKSNIYSLLTQAAQASGDYELALEYSKNYSSLIKDRISFAHQVSLKELHDEYRRQLLEEANMQLIIRQLAYVIIILIFILLLLYGIYYYIRLKHHLQNAQENIDHLESMALRYNAQEQSLRNVVLKNFNILKKAAMLKYYANDTLSLKMVSKINKILYGQEDLDWDQLYETMNTLHNNLFEKLKKSFPQLDQTEFKLCCLSVAKFTNIEIGLLLNYNINTITGKKAKLRKKLGIQPHGNIEKFLINYFEN